LTMSYHRSSNMQNRQPQRTPGKPDDGRRLRRVLLVSAIIVGVLFVLLEIAGCVLAQRQDSKPADGLSPPGAQDNRARILESKNASLRKKIAALAPKGHYVVIDTANNRVYLKKDGQILRDMIASCGSGNVLEDPVGGRTWTFETPRGEFQVRSKITKPIWIKPDWAFIEEGEPIPEKSSDRAEAGMMGDYALGIGQGYFIHGTLYKRLLGRNVSHGCVRLGDEDLKALYETAGIGTRVFIF
jgi:lipoprotein-anchoring transpeptidase ErfK/SrfK